MIAFRPRSFVAAAFAVIAFVTPAETRAGEARARLRHCGAETCLVINAARADPRATVSIAGHPVTARGGRSFSVTLPLDTVREWSAPFARSIAVRTESLGGGGSDQFVPLPIGLLGHDTGMAVLEIAAR